MMCRDPARLPPLDEIEAAGRKVINVIVNRLVAKVIQSNGRFPIGTLNRLSPDVRRAFLRRIVELAATPTFGRTRVKKQPQKHDAAPSPTKPALKSTPLRRIETDWASMRRDRPDYLMHAFQRGMIAAAVAGILAILLIDYFRL